MDGSLVSLEPPRGFERIPVVCEGIGPEVPDERVFSVGRNQLDVGEVEPTVSNRSLPMIARAWNAGRFHRPPRS